MIHRLHILGASGSGTTTLGRALAERLPCLHFDTDDYFWVPTDPPFTHQRERTERQRLLMDDVTAHNAWVVSGSLCGWGDVAISLFELVVFLWIPHNVRMARLHRREHARFGKRILHMSRSQSQRLSGCGYGASSLYVSLDVQHTGVVIRANAVPAPYTGDRRHRNSV